MWLVSLGEKEGGPLALSISEWGNTSLQILVSSTTDVGNLHLITTNASDCCFAFKNF